MDLRIDALDKQPEPDFNCLEINCDQLEPFGPTPVRLEWGLIRTAAAALLSPKTLINGLGLHRCNGVSVYPSQADHGWPRPTTRCSSSSSSLLA